MIEYADIIYSISPLDINVNKPDPLSTSLPPLMDKLESIQYQAALAITGTWKKTSKVKVYNLLGWEFLSKRRWVNQMVMFFKILNNLTPPYLRRGISFTASLRNESKLLSLIPSRLISYKCSFFQTCIYSWNNIISNADRNITSLDVFKIKSKSKIKISSTNNFGIRFFNKLRGINQLRVGLSPLNKHRFYYNFKSVSSPMCLCGETEDTLHFFRECRLFLSQRKILCSKIFMQSSYNLFFCSPQTFLNVLLYGNNNLSDDQNNNILSLTAEYIESTKRFS